MNELEYIKRVMKIVYDHDQRDDLYWNIDKDNNIKFFINCSDWFYWGAADGESVTPENVDLLEQSYEDAQKCGDFSEVCGGLLFCARVRKMRPQGAAYKDLNDQLKELFNAAGPSRDINVVNPQSEEGEYLYKRDPNKTVLEEIIEIPPPSVSHDFVTKP